MANTWRELVTERLFFTQIRFDSLDDARNVYALFSLPEVNQFVLSSPQPTFEHQLQYLVRTALHNVGPDMFTWWLRQDLCGMIVGRIALYRDTAKQPMRGSIGYWLSPTLWGKGLMTEAVRELVRFAFEETDMTSLEILAYSENIGSQKVARKCGFQLDGIARQARQSKGVIYDVHMFSLLKEEWHNNIYTAP